MHLFEILIVLHVITGLTGLIAFWVPIIARKGAVNHRRWGRICAYGFIGAGALAVIMALISLYGPETRIPSITDRMLFDGLFGWMMLYLGLLTIGFADYGLAVVKHSRNREALRGARYQVVIGGVLASAAYCFWYGFHIGEALMMAVAVLGIVAMGIQELYIWRSHPRPANLMWASISARSSAWGSAPTPPLCQWGLSGIFRNTSSTRSSGPCLAR